MVCKDIILGICNSRQHQQRWSIKPARARWKCFGNFSGISVAWLFLMWSSSVAVKNQYIPVKELCTRRDEDNFLRSRPRTIDGAQIVSENERDVDNCVVTFQTESILQRFMIRFESLTIDCNDNLIIYDGAHAIGRAIESISCEKSGDTVGRNGVIMTTSNFATLKYKTDSWGTEENGFKMIITAFRNSTLYGCHNGFQCSNDQCIAHELVCDNIHHCIDGADERHSEFCSFRADGALFSAIMSTGRICPCQKIDNSQKIANESLWRNPALGIPGWMGLDKSATIAIVLALILLTAALGVAYKLFFCKRNRDLRNDELRTANTGQYHGPSAMKSVNGVPGSSSTTATSMSLQMKNDSFRRNHNNYHYSNGGLQHTSNGNGLQGPGPPPALGSNVVESSNMLVSMNLPPSGNGRRPAVGRGFNFNKSFWLNLRPRLFWLPL